MSELRFVSDAKRFKVIFALIRWNIALFFKPFSCDSFRFKSPIQTLRANLKCESTSSKKTSGLDSKSHFFITQSDKNKLNVSFVNNLDLFI